MKKRCSIILAKILVFCMIINLMGQFNIPMVSIALTSANLSTDDAGVKFIKSHEGLRLTAYKATESETYYTIGYGHYGSDVYAGMTITEAQAEQFLRNDLKVKENNVRRQTSGLEMSQSQFNALVSLCYNTGGEKSIISNSPLVKYLRGELSESQARSQYSSYYVYSGNKKLQGLVNRRNDEANLFFTNDVPKPCQINDISGYGGPTEGYVHTPGANCGLYGTITSNHPLKHVWGGVYNQDGTKALGSSTTCDDYPNSTVYSLRGTFNNTIVFDDIPVGSYFFSISAEDNDGYSREVYRCNFTVGNPSITVSFNANGGTVSPASKTYQIGGEYSDLPTPSKIGYSFAGWFTESGEQKSNGSPIVSNSNHTLYAHWSINNYTVTLDSCGGNVSPGSINVSHGGSYSGLPKPTKTGYSFAGWYTSDGTKVSDGIAIILNSNHTLYAHWKANEYTMTVNPNGGSYSNSTSSVVQSPNLIYNSGNWWSIGKAEREGYTLTGYFTSAEGGTKVYDSNGECINGCGYWDNGKYINDGDLTIYAQWTPNTYTVKLNANGGTVSSESVQVTYDSTYNNLPTPERTGYNFNGWYTSADGGTQIANSDKVKITSELQLYARWSKDKFLITFDAMGGTALTTTKLVTYDKAYGVLPTAEKSGYTFKGWYLDKEYKTQITSDTVVKLTANQSVYAKWELRKYVVYFDSNGGECSTGSKQVTYGKTYGVLPVPIKENDEFSGWFTKDGIQIVSSDTVELTADTTLYAKWTSDGVIGDVNADGVFDIADVTMVQDWILVKPNATLTDWRAADVCQDDCVNSFDLSVLKRILIERS